MISDLIEGYFCQHSESLIQRKSAFVGGAIWILLKCGITYGHMGFNELFFFSLSSVSGWSVIRISRKGWHMLLNFLFHTAMTFGVFAGGINQIKYPVVCQVVRLPPLEPPRLHGLPRLHYPCPVSPAPSSESLTYGLFDFSIGFAAIYQTTQSPTAWAAEQGEDNALWLGNCIRSARCVLRSALLLMQTSESD